MFTGKALCGWPGLSPDGVLSPRPMPGSCSLTASASSLGRGPTNARVGGSGFKSRREVLSNSQTHHFRSGERSVNFPTSLLTSPVRKQACRDELPQQNSSPQPVKAQRAPSWERFRL